MKDFRKLWLLGALALLAGCDPYTKENKGALQVLSAFAVTGSSADNATGVWEATTTTSPFTIADVGSGTTVFFVKTNKLLDGAAIQTDPLSCVPASAVALTVNGAPSPAGWFTCYVPATSTPSEGASMVIYRGTDISATSGYFDSAELPSGFYTITATLTDQQGNTQTVTINAGVAITMFIDDEAVDVTTTSIHLTIDTVGTDHPGATTFDLQRAPNVDVDGDPTTSSDDVPGAWATIAADLPLTTTSYDDTGLTPATTYWYRTVLKSGTTVTATSAEFSVTTATP